MQLRRSILRTPHAAHSSVADLQEAPCVCTPPHAQLPVFHIGYFKNTVQILQAICKTCSRVLLPEKEHARFSRYANHHGTLVAMSAAFLLCFHYNRQADVITTLLLFAVHPVHV